MHTFRFQGHSPADPEHERGRKDEKAWARKEADPISLFEAKALEEGIMTQEQVRVCSWEERKELSATSKIFKGFHPQQHILLLKEKKKIEAKRLPLYVTNTPLLLTLHRTD